MGGAMLDDPACLERGFWLTARALLPKALCEGGKLIARLNWRVRQSMSHHDIFSKFVDEYLIQRGNRINKLGFSLWPKYCFLLDVNVELLVESLSAFTERTALARLLARHEVDLSQEIGANRSAHLPCRDYYSRLSRRAEVIARLYRTDMSMLGFGFEDLHGRHLT